MPLSLVVPVKTITVTQGGLLATILADVTEFEAGDPVAIQFDDWTILNSGFAIDLTPGNVDFKLPDGDLIATPFEDAEMDLPGIGAVLFSAGAQQIIVQKKK